VAADSWGRISKFSEFLLFTFAKEKNMINITIRILVGAFLGALVSLAYYKFMGCRTGTCPITSDPYASALFGVVVGGILAVIIRSE